MDTTPYPDVLTKTVALREKKGLSADQARSTAMSRNRQRHERQQLLGSGAFSVSADGAHQQIPPPNTWSCLNQRTLGQSSLLNLKRRVRTRTLGVVGGAGK